MQCHLILPQGPFQLLDNVNSEVDTIDQTLQALREQGFDDASCFSFKQRRDEYDKDAAYFNSWIASKQHGEMGYLERRQAERLEPTSFFPELDTVFVVLKRYGPVDGLPIDLDGFTDHTHSEGIKNGKENKEPAEMDRVFYSHYLNGVDYHESIKTSLSKAMSTVFHVRSAYKVCVDTSPVLERTMARLAGLGFTGKNTLLIHPKLGSMTFIGVVLTSLPFPNTKLDHIPFQERTETPDLNIDSKVSIGAHNHKGVNTLCGSCTRCIDACPTAAISPFHMDSNRCISYLTLEKRGPFNEAEKKLDFHGYVAGCDICQIVCPFNFKPFKYSQMETKVKPLTKDAYVELICETEQEYRARTKDTSLSRIKFADFKRNLEQGKD